MNSLALLSVLIAGDATAPQAHHSLLDKVRSPYATATRRLGNTNITASFSEHQSLRHQMAHVGPDSRTNGGRAAAEKDPMETVVSLLENEAWEAEGGDDDDEPKSSDCSSEEWFYEEKCWSCRSVLQGISEDPAESSVAANVVDISGCETYKHSKVDSDGVGGCSCASCMKGAATDLTFGVGPSSRRRLPIPEENRYPDAETGKVCTYRSCNPGVCQQAYQWSLLDKTEHADDPRKKFLAGREYTGHNLEGMDTGTYCPDGCDPGVCCEERLTYWDYILDYMRPDWETQIDTIKWYNDNNMSMMTSHDRDYLLKKREETNDQTNVMRLRTYYLSRTWKSAFKMMNANNDMKEAMMIKGENNLIQDVASSMQRLEEKVWSSLAMLQKFATKFGKKYTDFDRQFQTAVKNANSGDYQRILDMWSKFKIGMNSAFDVLGTAREAFKRNDGLVQSGTAFMDTWFLNFGQKIVSVQTRLKDTALVSDQLAIELGRLKNEKDYYKGEDETMAARLAAGLARAITKYKKTAKRYVARNEKYITKEWEKTKTRVHTYIQGFARILENEQYKIETQLLRLQGMEKEVVKYSSNWPLYENEWKDYWEGVRANLTFEVAAEKDNLQEWSNKFVNETLGSWAQANSDADDQVLEAQATSDLYVDDLRNNSVNLVSQTRDKLGVVLDTFNQTRTRYLATFNGTTKETDKDVDTFKGFKDQINRRVNMLLNLVRNVKAGASISNLRDQRDTIDDIGKGTYESVKKWWSTQMSLQRAQRRNFATKFYAKLGEEEARIKRFDAEVDAIRTADEAEGEKRSTEQVSLENSVQGSDAYVRKLQGAAARLADSILSDRDAIGVDHGKLDGDLNRLVAGAHTDVLRDVDHQIHNGEQAVRKMAHNMKQYVEQALVSQNKALTTAGANRMAVLDSGLDRVMAAAGKAKGLAGVYNYEAGELPGRVAPLGAAVQQYRSDARKNTKDLRKGIKDEFHTALTNFESDVDGRAYSKDAAAVSGEVLRRMDGAIDEVQDEPPPIDVHLHGDDLLRRIQTGVIKADDAGQELDERMQRILEEFQAVLSASADLPPAERAAALRFLEANTNFDGKVGAANDRLAEQVQEANDNGNAAMEKAALLLDTQGHAKGTGLTGAQLEAAAKQAEGGVKDAWTAQQREEAAAAASHKDMVAIAGALSDLLDKEGVELLHAPVRERKRVLESYGPVDDMVDKLVGKLRALKAVSPHADQYADPGLARAERKLDAEADSVAGDLLNVTAGINESAATVAADRAQFAEGYQEVEDIIATEHNKTSAGVGKLYKTLSAQEQSELHRNTEEMRAAVDALGHVVGRLPNFDPIFEKQHDLKVEMDAHQNFDLRQAFEAARMRMKGASRDLQDTADAERGLLGKLGRHTLGSIEAPDMPELASTHDAIMGYTKELQTLENADMQAILHDSSHTDTLLQKLVQKEKDERNSLAEAVREGRLLQTEAINRERWDVTSGLSVGYTNTGSVSSRAAALDQNINGLEVGARQLEGLVHDNAARAHAKLEAGQKRLEAQIQEIANKVGVPRSPAGEVADILATEDAEDDDSVTPDATAAPAPTPVPADAGGSGDPDNPPPAGGEA